MMRIGKQGIGKSPVKPVIKPVNLSGSEIIRRQKLLIDDKHSKDKTASSELPSKT